MSDLNEQQPVEREAPEVLGQSDIDAFANQTPVGATKAHKKAQGKRRRKWTTWVATLAAVAVLGGAVAAFTFWIKPEEEPKKPDNEPADTSVTLLDKTLKADGSENKSPVKAIKVKSRLDEYAFKQNKDGILQMVGEENLAMNSTAINSLVEELSLIVAKDTVATGLTDMTEYGFDAPTATVEVTYSDDVTVKLELASLAVGSHYYLRVDGGDTVYLVDSVLPGEVMQTAEAFVGLSMITAPSVSPDDPNGSPIMKELSLTGPVRDNVITTVRRREAEDSEEFVNSAYLLTAPYLMATDATVTTDVFATTDMFASEVVALHPSEEQLKEYGLDDPQSIAKIVLAVYTAETKADGTTGDAGYYNEMNHILKLGKQTADGTGYYAMADAKDVIYLVSAEDVKWATKTYHDFANQYLFLRNLNTLSSIACTLDGKTYDFKFEHFPEAEELDDQLKVTVDGKQYYTDEFRILYQVLMTLYRTGPAPEAPSGEPLLTVRITSLDESFSVNEVKIYPYSGSVYIAQTETGDTYKTTASRVDDAMQQIRNYLNGDPVINRF